MKMKIDIYTHIFPKKYREAFWEAIPKPEQIRALKQAEGQPALWDMDFRSEMLNKYEDVVQVLTMSVPPLEIIPNVKDAIEVARIGNDEMAEIISGNPRQFVAGVA